MSDSRMVSFLPIIIFFPLLLCCNVCIILWIFCIFKMCLYSSLMAVILQLVEVQEAVYASFLV